MNELDLIDNNNYTICFNGSLIVDNLEKKMFESYIDENVAIKIDEFIKSNDIDWTYYLEDSRLLRRDIININEFVTKNKIHKIVGISTPEEISKIRNNLPECILENLEITSSEINRIEFVNKGMTKVKAIELVLNKLTIDKENVVAIGDGENAYLFWKKTIEEYTNNNCKFEDGIFLFNNK